MNYKDFYKSSYPISPTKISSKECESERQIMLERTRRLTKDILNEKKLRIFDLDDTLVKTNSYIYVKKGDEEFKLTPGEYAVYEPEGNEKFDFRDFKKLIEPKKIKKYNKLLQRFVKASGHRKVVILTARHALKPVKEYLRMVDLEDEVNIVALSDGDPNAKKRYVQRMISGGNYNDVFFIDDSHKNVKAVQSLEKEFPDIKIDTRLAKV